MQRHSHSRHGLSLVESAIALGVIGAVMASIWGIASTSYERVRREQTIEQVTIVANNVRVYNQSQQTMQGLAPTALNPYYIKLNIILRNMVRSPTTGCTNPANAGLGTIAGQCADTLWGPKKTAALVDGAGTFQVCNWSMGSTVCNLGIGTQFFGLQLEGLPIGACIELGGKISGPSGPTGLVDVVINNYSMANHTKNFQPVSAADLTANCNVTGFNTVIFVYSLSVPS